MTDNTDTIQFDPEKIAKLQPWNLEDHIQTDAEIVAYLDALLDDDEPPHPSDLDVLRNSIRAVANVLRKRTA